MTEFRKGCFAWNNKNKLKIKFNSSAVNQYFNEIKDNDLLVFFIINKQKSLIKQVHKSLHLIPKFATACIFF